MTLPETSTPILAAAFVGGTGLLGIIAGIVAWRHVSVEGRTLEKGEDALAAHLSPADLEVTDPIAWLALHDLPKDSHFGDHLLSVWWGWIGERVPTLAELHSLSARRERRRLSARISGGITALLLICGIAGTLLCIHPILKAFTIPVNEKAEVLIDPMVAQELIRSLGSAFLPSLAALVATVLVAILRGVYLQSTTGLAWQLDRFAVAKLFPMFKPKRFGAELTAVHVKLSRLVDRMEERDRDFGEAVGILGKAAEDLKDSGPRLKAASDRITLAADRLATETESITKALETHLGENSSLASGTRSITLMLETCQAAATQLRDSGTTLATALAEASGQFATSRTQLGLALGQIPQQIQQGCDAGSKSLVEAAGTFERERDRLTAAVAGIPQQIQQGCEVGGRTLTEANERATQGTAAAIGRSADAFSRAASEASNLAAETIGEATRKAADLLKAELGPVPRAAPDSRNPIESATGFVPTRGGLGRTGGGTLATASKIIAPAAPQGDEPELEPVTYPWIERPLEGVVQQEAPRRTALWKRIASLGILK